MVRRIVFTLIFVVAAAAISLANTSTARAVAPRSPSASALFKNTGDGRVTIAWAFRVDDILSCSNSALTLRHVTARFGERIRLVAVAIGDDPGMIESFMRTQRLRPEILRMSESDYHRTFASSPLPSIHLISEGRIQATAVDSTWADGRKRRERPMEVAVAELLDASARGSSTAARTSFTERQR